MAYSVGVDVGGETTMCGLVADGQIIEATTKPTGKNPQELADTVAAVLKETLDKKGLSQGDIAGVGIGVPAFPNPVTGKLRFPNIQEAADVDLQGLLSERLRVKFVVGNDADYTALGAVQHTSEFEVMKEGAGSKGGVELVLLTLGTGIGGGVIVRCNGEHRILSGAGGLTELGHIKVTEEPEYLCGCGAVGCVEATSSCKAIVRKVRRSLEKAPEEIRNGFIGEFSCIEIEEQALGENTLAQQVMESAGKYLGLAAANILNTFNPSTLAFTGGGAHSPSDGLFFTSALGVIRQNALPEVWEAASIIKNPDAKRYGVLGAASSAF